MQGGGGAKGAIFSATPAQGGPANTNLQGDKKFVDGGGGIIVVYRGPKGILGPGPPYFTELAWAAPVILRRGKSSVLSFDLWQLALKPQELPTSDQGWINVARGSWQILARGSRTKLLNNFFSIFQFIGINYKRDNGLPAQLLGQHV